MNMTSTVFEIKGTENYYNLKDTPANPKEIYANIPKFMPRIAKANPAKSKDAINKGIFCNDTTCKPHPKAVITLQNYITIRQHPSRQIYLGSRINKAGNMIAKHTKLTAEIMHGDIRKIYITDKE